MILIKEFKLKDYRDKLYELGITATRSGKYFCPRCREERKNKNDKSLSVQYQFDRVLYKCHHCGFEGVVFMDSYNYTKTEPSKVYTKPTPPVERDNKEILYSYFEKRGIPKEIVDFYKVGVNDNKEILLKYYKNGELVNIKYRTNLGDGKKTFRSEKNAEPVPYGMDQIDQRDVLTFVEGEIDVLSLATIGIQAISVPNGASEKNLTWFENNYDWINSFNEYVIMVDNDEAGKKMEATLLERLDKVRTKVAKFNQDKDDANTVLVRDKDELINVWANAEYVDIAGFTSFGAKEDDIKAYFNNGYRAGASTGWNNVDRIFTIKKGYLMIVTGYPTRGKSYFCDNLIFNLSKKYGWRHLVCSFENTLENHFARFASFYTGKKFNKFEMSEEELDEALKFFNDKIYRVELNRMWDIDSLIEQLEYAKHRFNIDTFTIDPYNRLANPSTEREDKYIGQMLAKLTMAAKRLDVLIIFIAHPKKPQVGEKVPDMYAISGSSDWYNMADYGIVIHRDRKPDGTLENNVRVIVHKVKDFQLGNPAGGEVNLLFNTRNFLLEDN